MWFWVGFVCFAWVIARYSVFFTCVRVIVEFFFVFVGSRGFVDFFGGVVGFRVFFEGFLCLWWVWRTLGGFCEL